MLLYVQCFLQGPSCGGWKTHSPDVPTSPSIFSSLQIQVRNEASWRLRVLTHLGLNLEGLSKDIRLWVGHFCSEDGKERKEEGKP